MMGQFREDGAPCDRCGLPTDRDLYTGLEDLCRACAERDAGLDTPTPGSDEAYKRGCTCPVMDNRRGAGRPTTEGTMFVMTSGCPLHDPAEKERQP